MMYPIRVMQTNDDAFKPYGYQLISNIGKLLDQIISEHMMRCHVALLQKLSC